MQLDDYYALKDAVEAALELAISVSAPYGVVISLKATRQEIINTMKNSLTGSTELRSIRQEVDENGNVVSVLKEWTEEDLRII